MNSLIMNKRITLINTTRCNFHCRHCIREYPNSHMDIPIDLVRDLLPQAKALGYKHVAITGGEPSHHPNFQELVDVICQSGFCWSVVTNGFDPAPYLETLEQHRESCNFMAISFDGAIPTTHDEIRQSGSFEKAWEAVSAFQEEGVVIHTCFTVNARNQTEVAAFIDLAEVKGVDKVLIASVTPTKYNRDLVLSRKEKTRVYASLQNIISERKISIHYTTSMYGFPDTDLFCSNLNDPEPAINPYGEYIQCCDNQGQGAVLGNLREKPFSDLFIKQIQTAVQLKDIRKKLIENKEYFPGFNSCNFCNVILQDKIRHVQSLDKVSE